MKRFCIVLLLLLSFSVFSQTKKDSVSQKEIATVIETMPEFPGGPNAMMKYVSNKLILPALNHEQIPNSSVYSKFIVNSDGSISDVVMVKSSGINEVDNAIKELILKMPKWKPATQNGKAVNCYFNLPIVCIK